MICFNLILPVLGGKANSLATYLYIYLKNINFLFIYMYIFLPESIYLFMYIYIYIYIYSCPLPLIISVCVCCSYSVIGHFSLDSARPLPRTELLNKVGRTCSKYRGGETLAGHKILACGTRKDKTTCCTQAEVGE